MYLSFHQSFVAEILGQCQVIDTRHVAPIATYKHCNALEIHTCAGCLIRPKKSKAKNCIISDERTTPTSTFIRILGLSAHRILYLCMLREICENEFQLILSACIRHLFRLYSVSWTYKRHVLPNKFNFNGVSQALE